MSRKEKLKQLYDKLIPPFCRLPLWLMLIWNVGGYELFKLFTFGREPYDMTLPIDEAIPVLAPTVLIYFASFVFWFFGYIVASRIDKPSLCRFFAADVTAKLVTFILFVAFPSVRVRPEVVGEGFFPWLLRLLYVIDTPFGLFPSIHCLNSWLCFLGVRSQKSVPLWYKIFACVFALAIFASTLTTAQHVFVDVISGAALGEIFWFVSGHTPLSSLAGKTLEGADKVKERFFGLFKRKSKAAQANEE